MRLDSIAKEEKSDVSKLLENLLKSSFQELILWFKKHKQALNLALGQAEGLTDHLRN